MLKVTFLMKPYGEKATRLMEAARAGLACDLPALKLQRDGESPRAAKRLI